MWEIASSQLPTNMASSGSVVVAKPRARLDGLGIFWIVFALSWTFLLACGMTFLYLRRDMPMLRIRGLSVSFVAIIFLHLYWGAVQTGYCYGPLAPPVVEFWIMSIWLPFGIALFHASNSRFLHVAQKQKDLFAHENASSLEKPKRAKSTSLLGRFRDLDYSRKILVLVGIGMGFQFVLTIVMYLVSRKFHKSFGVPGTEVTGTEEQKKSSQGRGWEWWPSVFWQFFWAWIIAPVILWKARGIHDTQGWRFQTIACCLANLHATPMWLVALYVPAMAPINKYWIPPQWIAISIMMLEIFTVFFPCWEVMRHQTLRQETLDSIAQWEANNKGNPRSARSVATGSTTVAGSAFTAWSKDSKASSQESILTMGALEHVLERNPEPLQKFSALRDFSGENIAFLRAVAEWKSSLPPAVRDPERLHDGSIRELVRERFNSALRIYTNFISSRDAEFQVNLSSHDLKKLEAVFEYPARVLFGNKREVDPATPFDMFSGPNNSNLDNASSHGSETGIIMEPKRSRDVIGDKALYWGEIPDGFDEAVFDDSEASIKYLVLTNTWPKFVKDRRISLESDVNLEAGHHA
ncbi:hypothetical protein B0T10DRAFT_513920 [Thelonectria olida]|uniref:RGS domain-containing protein n=1 Tax=Thelonectria olida TaxID=1576542 RepID=A0A9P8W6G3_9HYPO|nr:hypothetical protein B0T10DRAFT_513920 [Thelonectria olida]